MAVHFEESKTKENLMRAFAGESQARNRYTIAAERARRAGMDTIAEMFLYTADQERAHAERFYELLKEESGKTIFIDGGYPVDQQENLADLLKAAEHNEKEEFEEIYPAFAEIAKQEGFFEAASAFLQIAEDRTCASETIRESGEDASDKSVLRGRGAGKMDLHKLRIYP